MSSNSSSALAMAQTDLSAWGTGQGVRVPKKMCDAMGISVGTHLELQALRDDQGAYLVIRPQERRRDYGSAPYVSMDDVFADWSGSYEPPADWPTIHNEIDWGEDVGSEVVK